MADANDVALRWGPLVALFVVELAACGGVVRQTVDEGAAGAPAAGGSGGQTSIIPLPSVDAGASYVPFRPRDCTYQQREIDVALPDPATLAAASFASYCGVQLPDLSPYQFDPAFVQILLTPSAGIAVLDEVGKRSDCTDYGHTYKGWYYDDDAHPTRIEFCPETCREIGEVGGRVTMSFGCADPNQLP